jgi:anti-sigma factor RsiW
MTCERASARFEDYLDAALPEIERQEFDRHLRTCASCKSELIKLRSLRSLLAELPAESAAPGALDSILQAAGRIRAGSHRVLPPQPYY